MLTSLALVFLVGLALAALCQKLKLPRIIGMLATGILLGPCVLNVLDGSILSISADLRKLALVIILLKAGLSLDLGDLKKVGRPAILMSCLPATCEIIGYVLLAPYFLGVTHAEAAVMGENSAVLHGETFSSISNHCQGPEKAARLKAAYFFLPVQYESIIPINLL